MLFFFFPFSSLEMSFHCCILLVWFSAVWLMCDFLSVILLRFHCVGLSFNLLENSPLLSLLTIILLLSFPFQTVTSCLSDHLELCHRTHARGLFLLIFFFLLCALFWIVVSLLSVFANFFLLCPVNH